ncbi:MAG: hypothetical protein PVH62_07435 [Anaerolineae bacterium]|jgi:hypothetical protein
MSEEELNRLKAVKAAYEMELLQKANVVGVGIGTQRRAGQLTGEPSIVVSVTRKVPRNLLDPGDVIPPELDGVPVDVQEVGILRPLQERV